VGPLALAAAEGLVTGGDIDPCGEHLLIRTYAALFEFTLPAGKPFEAIFGATGVKVPSPTTAEEPKGEAVTYAGDGRGYFTSSEAKGAPSVGLHGVTCAPH